MKKLLLAAMMLMALSCSQNKPKVLVLYYSQGGMTRTVAEELSARLGADMEEIVAVNPYDGDFMATIERSGREREEGILPEIQPLTRDIKAYDVVFLGFPVWYGTYALPVATFLNSTDLSGKKVVPFCTFGSGGLDSSAKALKEAQPAAEVLPGYGVRAARIDAVPAEIDRFLKENGWIEGAYEKYEEFPEAQPVSEEQSAIFDAAVAGYPMLSAKAVKVSSRAVTGGTEYLFDAEDISPKAFPGFSRDLKVYVLVLEGQAPVFTQVIR